MNCFMVGDEVVAEGAVAVFINYLLESGLGEIQDMIKFERSQQASSLVVGRRSSSGVMFPDSKSAFSAAR